MALAFSGGVDSSFLLAACRDAGVDCLAVTVESVFQSESEREAAFELVRGDAWLRIPLDVLAVEGVRDNPPDRCYLCKRAIFSAIISRTEGRCVIDGTNYDDLGDFRRACGAARIGRALAAYGAGLDQEGYPSDVARAQSAHRRASGDVLSGDAPAMGERIDPGKLRAVDMAEIAIKRMGFEQVRVRAHGDIARIELDRTMLVRAAEHAREIVNAVKAAGFKRAALDLDGYNMGNMNERNVRGK